jgi:Xaa-Pro dipeptidase
MGFSNSKRHQPKIESHIEKAEDLYSLNKHALGPGVLAESEWLAAGLESPNMTIIREY